MWHRFGQGLNAIILCAAERADTEHCAALSTRHLLWALAAHADLPAAQVLTALGVSLQAVQDTLRQAVPGEQATGQTDGLTPAAREAVDAAYCLAAEIKDTYIGGEHLLLALIRCPDEAGRALAALGVTWAQAGAALMDRQTWRTHAPEGVTVPGLPARTLLLRLRGKAGTWKRLAFGLSRYQKPYAPYLVFQKRITDNPYPFYSRLRSQPVYWDAMLGHWVVTRYEDVAAALSDTRLSQRLFSNASMAHPDLPPVVQREFRCLQSGLDRQMLFQDAPDQPRQRALVARRFTPRVIARMESQIGRTADALLDAVAGSGRMDVINDLAVPFPLHVITCMMGLPLSDVGLFKKWSKDYFRYLTFETTLTDDLAAYKSVRKADAYFRALLPARRGLPLNSEDDLVTLLCRPGDDGEVLPDDEIVANCLMLLATGHENTTRLIGTGLLTLLRRPDQWRMLCENPALAASVVEEMLRFDSPVQWTMRHLEEEIEWRGSTLQKGQRVQIGIGAANRDPNQFPNADLFDITRSPNRHLSFGHGPHFCLGAALARLEAQTIFRELSCRFPGLHLVGAPEWTQEGLAFRGLKSLHVGWNAAGA